MYMYEILIEKKIKPNKALHTYNTSAGGSRAHYPASLAITVSFRFSKKPFLKRIQQIAMKKDIHHLLASKCAFESTHALSSVLKSAHMGLERWLRG